MDWFPIVLVAMLLLIALLFYLIWQSGYWNPPKPPTPNTNNIEEQVDILMPPSNWSEPTLGVCKIYNFPIIDGIFPTVTNDPNVVKTLQSVTSTRCYYSNELALAEATTTCIRGPCIDSYGQTYTTGQSYTYYAPCSNSCYEKGVVLGSLVISMSGNTFPKQAVSIDKNNNLITAVPNLEDSNQYIVMSRYRSSTLSTTDPRGNLCNFQHYLTGLYLDIVKVGENKEVWLPRWTDKKPNKALWLLVAPSSIGYVVNDQRIVYVGEITLDKNPTVNEFYSLADKEGLRALVYGINDFAPPPYDRYKGLFLWNALTNIGKLYSYDSQFVDLSRYNLMLNAATSSFPYYLWSLVNV